MERRCRRSSKRGSGACWPEPEAARQSEILPPLPSWNGGGELVDISDRDALYRAMEEE